MSNTSIAGSDFQQWEAQLASSSAVANSRMRARGWAFALIASVVLWAAIVVGIIAAIRAVS